MREIDISISIELTRVMGRDLNLDGHRDLAWHEIAISV